MTLDPRQFNPSFQSQGHFKRRNSYKQRRPPPPINVNCLLPLLCLVIPFCPTPSVPSLEIISGSGFLVYHASPPQGEGAGPAHSRSSATDGLNENRSPHSKPARWQVARGFRRSRDRETRRVLSGARIFPLRKWRSRSVSSAAKDKCSGDEKCLLGKQLKNDFLCGIQWMAKY